MGLSFDTPINFDVLLINTFITQLPVVFGELGCVSLVGVFERPFVISIATFERNQYLTVVKEDAICAGLRVHTPLRLQL